MNRQRKQRILTKLAAEKAPSEGVNKVLRILGSRKLGFGDVKANKQTASTVPGQEVLHSGGKWAQQALAQQEARIGIRPSLPTPGAALVQKQASIMKFLDKFRRGKAATKKPMTALQKKEIALGLRSSSGAPVRVSTGPTRQFARINA